MVVILSRSKLVSCPSRSNSNRPNHGACAPASRSGTGFRAWMIDASPVASSSPLRAVCAGATRRRATAPTRHSTTASPAPPRGGVFDRVFGALAGRAGEPNRLIIDTTHSRAHWTAASPLKREPLRNAPPEPKEGSTPRSTSFATTRNPGCNVALREVGARPEGR